MMAPRKFSRHMPPMPNSRTPTAGKVAIGVLTAGFGAAVIAAPAVILGIVGVLAASTILLEQRRTQRMGPLLTARDGEDVGSFARAFNRHAGPLDPWAIRAVWHTVVPMTTTRGKLIPLRPSDRFVEDLGIDPEDIEYAVPKLVTQCERDIKGYRTNPYYTKLDTVGGLVRFISAQPLKPSSVRVPAP
jgi:hypothetical protein